MTNATLTDIHGELARAARALQNAQTEIAREDPRPEALLLNLDLITQLIARCIEILPGESQQNERNATPAPDDLQ